MALIQRSCGYALRPTLMVADIERAAALIKAQSAGRCVVAVDNCYGEFTEAREPCAVGRSLLSSLLRLMFQPFEIYMPDQR